MPPKASPQTVPVRLSDLMTPAEQQKRDAVLLAVRIPKVLNTRVSQIAKSLGKHKNVAVQALLNEGIAAYEVVSGKKKRGRPKKN